MSFAKRDLLVERMRKFDGNFDGYPGHSETDIELVQNAVREYVEETYTLAFQEQVIAANPVIMMATLASNLCRTPKQYHNARRFIFAYCENIFDCNMAEGDNPVYGTDDDCVDERTGAGVY
jgi:hypothetical protein